MIKYVPLSASRTSCQASKVDYDTFAQISLCLKTFVRYQPPYFLHGLSSGVNSIRRMRSVDTEPRCLYRFWSARLNSTSVFFFCPGWCVAHKVAATKDSWLSEIFLGLPGRGASVIASSREPLLANRLRTLEIRRGAHDNRRTILLLGYPSCERSSM